MRDKVEKKNISDESPADARHPRDPSKMIFTGNVFFRMCFRYVLLVIIIFAITDYSNNNNYDKIFKNTRKYNGFYFLVFLKILACYSSH